jgi:thioredoxin 1
MIEPLLVKLSSESEYPLKIVSINADENLRLANTYRLKNLPTLLLFEGGNLRKKLDNFDGREGLQQILENMMLPLLLKAV